MTSGYTLCRVRVTYIARLREELERTIATLRRTMDWCPTLVSTSQPVPQRRQRRAWRVWYNKAPHAIGWSKRHYVFHDWRYSVNFENITDPRYVKAQRFNTLRRRTISTSLGSMTQDTSCVVDFVWYDPGSSQYSTHRGELSANDPDDVKRQILLGKGKIEKFNLVMSKIKQSDPSISKHLYLNFREYHGNNAS
jgi:hypothetical protein